ncbi:MAG: hypothetical protein QXY45_00765 [Candidatus Aenigmatarchaeota archaeon]
MKTRDIPGIILILILFLSAISILYPLISNKNGVIVLSVSENSSCREILIPGSLITKVNDFEIENKEDFYSIVGGLSGRSNFIVNGGPRVCTVNEKIDVKVSDQKKEGLKFGTDIGKGVELKIKLSDSDKDLKAIKSRLEILGIGYAKPKKIDNKTISLLINPLDENLMEDVLKTGKVEVKMMKYIELKNGTGKFVFNGKTHDIKSEEDGILFSNHYYKNGDKLKIDDIEVEIENVSENYTFFYFKVFDGNEMDISKSQNIRSFQSGKQFVFVLETYLSDEASKRFSTLTKDQPVIVNPSGENYLQDPMVVFVDGEIFTSFPVFVSEAGKEIKEINLWGVETSGEIAKRKLDILKLYLKSGEISGAEIIERIEIIGRKNYLLKTSLYLTLGITLISSGLILVRFKKTGALLLILVFFISEILIFLGVLSNRWFGIVVFLFFLGFSVLNVENKRWFKWICISIMSIFIFSTIPNKLILEEKTIYGFIAGFILSAIYIYTLTSRSKNKRIENIFWYLNLIILLSLMFLFFTKDYRNLSIAFGLVNSISIGLLGPELSRRLEND